MDYRKIIEISNPTGDFSLPRLCLLLFLSDMYGAAF